jgi:hypothetical protein
LELLYSKGQDWICYANCSKKEKEEEGEFAFIKAKAVVPRFCFVQQLQTTSRILDPLTSI